MTNLDGSTRGRPRKVAGVGLTAAIVLAASACSSGNARSSSSSSPRSTAAAGGTATSAADGAGGAGAVQKAFVSVVHEVRPEVVEIRTSSDLGSGIVYDTKGDIVTNDHVVGSATSFQVRFADGQTLSAHLVGAYPPDDLAVIKVSGARNLRAATFADSSNVQPGDIVFAIGNPLGLASSVTEGVVSFNGREVSEGNGVVLPDTIQTSAPINPGNSGGALVDLSGKVVGIPTLAAIDQQINGSAAPGIGFAIASNTVANIASQLVSKGKVTNSGRAALGIQAIDAVGRAGNPAGALVVGESKGGPAAKAGIPVGVAVTAVDGTSTHTVAALEDVLAKLDPGQRVKVTYLTPKGSTHTVTVTLGQLSGSSAG